ncbi:MAG: hypothetical protein ACRYGO_22700 [Janthinobacterium lividum]
MSESLRHATGITTACDSHVEATGLYSPYAEPHVNFMYNLLFCDDVELFRRPGGGDEDGLWGPLLADTPDRAALLGIAEDDENEARVRVLAYNRLRAMGGLPLPKKLLGVIVEVALDGGLDVLAAFSEGGVRYLNQSGKVAVFEGADTPVSGLAQELVAVSEQVVGRIGPWDEQRLPPPKPGNVRITFLVSDGLYFGEGPFETLRQDGMAGPILSKAVELLQKAAQPGPQ